MNRTVYNFRSYTDAMKANSLFSRNGIHAVYGKNTSPKEGCIHTLAITSDAKETEKILRENGIHYSVASGGV